MTANPLEVFYSEKCVLCGRMCRADRSSGPGACGAGDFLKIASASLHFGEEPPISGSRGSGTIFFSHCSMKCIYCQNYPISQMGVGNSRSAEWLTGRMLELQAEGAHNINFVTPTHYSYHIFEAVAEAKKRGLKIPTVWNTSSYENPSAVKFIDEIADIYLADIRYASDSSGLSLSSVNDYTGIVFSNLRRFNESKGILRTDGEGIAQKGLIVRMLLLPGMTGDCMRMLDFVAGELGKNTFVSIMSQYVPYYNAHSHPELKRRVNVDEYERVVEYADKLGLENAFIQEMSYTEE